MSFATLMEVRFGAHWLIVMVSVVEEDGLTAEEEKVAAVRAGQDVRIEDERGRTVGDDAAIDGQHTSEAAGGAGQVVGRRDDGLAAPGLGLQEVHEVLLGRGVDTGDRLVEEEQVRLGGERPGEEDPSPLTAR